ncbi:MAG: DUF805 domain-containing protein [Gammaproteobacteria bacterium]|nr:DUF805 domain-containing protein [Gammaproteobacteria bacterium]
MTAIVADGQLANDFVQDAYKAPSADLIGTSGEAVENKAFSRKGRMGVLSYWARMPVGVLAMVVSIVPFSMLMSSSVGSEPNMVLMLLTGAIMTVGVIVSMLYMVVNAIKRLHDINMSGWMMLLNFIPIVGAIFSIYMSVMPGKAEPNRFAGATKPTSTLGKVVGGICLGLYALIFIGYFVLLVMGVAM